ncbi:MAG: hypothetical protein SH857_03615 [Chitinophagales bacterium]|nr:hypothetical protein [Chitinophagales bacterium]
MDSILSLLQFFSTELDRKGISYMVSRGVALNTYTTPRMTRDIDVVIALRETEIESFLQIFNKGFYVSKESVKVEVKRKDMFNVIDQATGYKIDFIVKKDSEYRAAEFSRRKRSTVFGFETWLVTPEDLIISKLVWIQELYSDRQMDDIKNLLKNPDVDTEYIKHWCGMLGINTFQVFSV